MNNFPFLSIRCSELFILEACLHSECQCCQADSEQPSHRPRSKLPGHHYQFTENNSSPKQPSCSQHIALNPARSESLQGKFCYCGLITLQKWLYLFVISIEVAVQCCALLCIAPCSWVWAWEWCVLVRQPMPVTCFQTAVWKSCCCKEALITHLNP